MAECSNKVTNFTFTRLFLEKVAHEIRAVSAYKGRFTRFYARKGLILPVFRRCDNVVEDGDNATVDKLAKIVSIRV